MAEPRSIPGSAEFIDEEDANSRTMTSLNKVDNDTLIELSRLTLPEIEKIKTEIARILPAGNLPGLILMGLTSIQSRHISRKKAEDDISALFQGSSILPQSLFSVLIGGPAVVLSTYQRLLELAGKDMESAFPEGTWQFYLQFGLREDTGRHTNETIGYHRDRPAEAGVADDITAWLMTSIYTLFDSDGLTGTIWDEWTTLRLIDEAAREAGFARSNPFKSLLRNWQTVRPYVTPAGASYADRRRFVFDQFTKDYFDLLPADQVKKIKRKLHKLAQEERAAYQRQMSQLAYLKPSRHRDERMPIPLWKAKVGLVVRGHNYLFDACIHDEQARPLAFTEQGGSWPLEINAAGQPVDPQGRPLFMKGGWFYLSEEDYATPIAYVAPPDPALIKGLVEEILAADLPVMGKTAEWYLVEAPRASQEHLRGLLPASTQQAILELAHAPILVNWDEHPRNVPLGKLRRMARRGAGDHSLTIIRTGESVVFDQSHIFFDGLWGMAMAEVMTNQAVAWCRHAMSTQAQPGGRVKRLALVSSPNFEAACAANRDTEGFLVQEASAETGVIDLDAMQKARYWLKQRGVDITINDLLVLARCIHAMDYSPSQDVARKVAEIPGELIDVMTELIENAAGLNPALLIPMDASMINPRERLYPTTFRNPLAGMLDSYNNALQALKNYLESPDSTTWQAVDFSRREFFAYLQMFGELLDALKGITMRGESFNVATMKLLAHLPPSMQSLLDQIPQHISVLNEVIKGEEVFSNVGRVAKDSSLTRFISAKDDGRSKKLIWGIITDDQDNVHVSMRDFRPHVKAFADAGRMDLADLIARDYVESYGITINRLVTVITQLSLIDKGKPIGS